MKPNSLTLFSAVLCACSLPLQSFAGEPVSSKQATIPPAPPAEDPWEFTISPYGWAAGLDGVTGVKGFTVETDVPFTDILSNLDMTAMLNIEARKGRWGGWIDGLYLKMSAGDDPSGPLLNSVGLSIQQVIAEAAIFYRIWEGDRGFFDVYAGARYMSVSGELSLDVSDSGVENVSQRISDEVVSQVVDAVSSKAEAALVTARDTIARDIAATLTDRVADATSRVEDAKNSARTSIATAVSTRSAEIKSSVQELQTIAAANPQLTEAIRNDAGLRSAILNVAEARIDQKIAAVQQDVATAVQALAQVQQTVSAAAQAAVTKAQEAVAAAQAAADAAKSKASKAVAKAEKKLADEIEDALRDAIPDEISGSADWVDPFVGLRARYNFTDRLYAIAKADIGGFGVSSDLVWQVYGALGYHLTKSGKTTVELGYKHMALDYTSGGFTYDVAMSGAMISLGLKF